MKRGRNYRVSGYDSRGHWLAGMQDNRTVRTVTKGDNNCLLPRSQQGDTESFVSVQVEVKERDG
jgi:hypothetical protein